MIETIKDPEKRFDGILNYWLPRWIKHSMENYQTIKGLIDAKVASDLLIMKDAYTGKHKAPALILGSGASLDSVLDFFGTNGNMFPGIVFASASNAVNAIMKGVHPHFVGAYDGHENAVQEQLYMIRKILHSDTTLITHPFVSPKVFKEWGGNKRKMLLYSMGQPNVEFFDKYFKYMYPFIHVRLLNFGCTVNNLIEIATFMGCSPIFLAGVDFGFSGDRYSCTRYEIEHKKVGIQKKGKRKHTVEKVEELPHRYLTQDEKDFKKVGNKSMQMSVNGIWTTDEMVDYKVSLMALYRLDKAQLIMLRGDSTYQSIITELPVMTPSMVIDKGELSKDPGMRYREYLRTESEIKRISEEYLARFNVRRKVKDGEEVLIKEDSGGKSFDNDKE